MGGRRARGGLRRGEPGVSDSRLVVMISGHGSNLQAIVDACTSGELPAQVVAVVSNREEALGLERARLAHVSGSRPTLAEIAGSP